MGCMETTDTDTEPDYAWPCWLHPHWLLSGGPCPLCERYDHGPVDLG